MAKKSFYKFAQMLFLKVLRQENCYGYQLTQSIQDITKRTNQNRSSKLGLILYKLQKRLHL